MKLRLKDSIVLGLTFQCPCGRTNRCKVSSIIGQNDQQVQFKCGKCKAIVSLPKKKEDIEKQIGVAHA